MTPMRTFSDSGRGRGRRGVSVAGRRVRVAPRRDAGSRAARGTASTPAALAAIESEYVEPIDRRVRTARRAVPKRSSTRRSTACCARSIRTRASSRRGDFARMRERQEGRYFGIGITIQKVGNDVVGDVALRRFAGLSRRHPPRRRHRAGRRRRTPKPTWTDRRTSSSA